MTQATAEINENRAAGKNKMGVMPVGRLIITMSLPVMLSMLVQALYNFIDSVYVSRIGENALTALTMAYPAQYLMIAVMTGTGVGVNALLSKSLGEKNRERASQAANTGIFLGIAGSILFAVLGLLFTRYYFTSQTGLQEIIDYGTEYLGIVTIFSFGLAGQVTFERLLQSTGKTLLSMITQCSGAVLNIILDPILIFGWLGLPAMGVKGAAVATVISQCTAATLAFILNISLNNEIKLKITKIRPRAEVIKRILAVGIPVAVMMSISSAMIYGLNRILIVFTPTAIAVFGAYFRLEHFLFMPVVRAQHQHSLDNIIQLRDRQQAQDITGNKAQHPLCDCHDGHRFCAVPDLPRPFTVDVQGLGNNAGDRRTCLQENKHLLYIRRFLRSVGFCIPGAGQRSAEYAGIVGTPASGAVAAGIRIRENRRAGCGLVGISAGRDRFSRDVHCIFKIFLCKAYKATS